MTVLLFGLGLIGGAVDRALYLFGRPEMRIFPYDWRDPEERGRHWAAIRDSLPSTGRIALVWTAGQGGFGSSAAEMAQETALVGELVKRAQELSLSARPVDFHLMSSAGGLFENQTHCDRNSTPAPLRPYGVGKLHQEQLLRQAAGLDRCRIYRPSSVYGITRSRRVGLITALISNALRGRTTRIFGNPNTLRDYVLVEDIGNYLAQKILKPDHGPAVETLLLANGRSASIFEVIERIRERTDRPLLLQFDPHPANVSNMSFLPSALPTDWQATSLASGIARIATSLRSGSV